MSRGDIRSSGTRHTHAPLAAHSAFEEWEHEQAAESKRRKGPVHGGVLYYNADKTKVRNPETHRWVHVESPLAEHLMGMYGTPVEQLGGETSPLTDIYNNFVAGVNKLLYDLNLAEKPKTSEQAKTPKTA